MRRFLPILILFVLSILLAGCAQQAEEGGKKTITVTDAAGRTVEVPENVERIVAIGPGALRLVVYLQAVDRVVGVEDAETMWGEMGRPYRMAHPELAEKPVIGRGGPYPSPNYEKIAELKPDVVFVSAYPEIAEDVQQKTGIPAVVVSYGKLGSFDDRTLLDSLRLMGKILGKEKRAEEVVSFIESAVKDLSSRAENARKAPTVYVGAISYKGGHGIESTQCSFAPLTVLKAKNVACEVNMSGAIFIDKEKLAEWDPDVIFIDLSNLELVKADFQKNPDFYRGLKAFREGRVYGILPFNYYWTNVEIAIADAYYMGKVLYPEQFSDIDPVKKANEVFRFFVGKELYSELERYYGGFGEISGEFT
ncbi:iron ABC transporter substrate-binding protein [Geoglobus sp.]